MQWYMNTAFWWLSKVCVMVQERVRGLFLQKL